MNWEILTDKQQFDSLMQNETLFAVFKHSTRCSISSMAKNRIEKEWNHQFPIYYLDLLQHRDVSNHIADVTNIEHQSPQLIVIKNGKPIYDASHNFIYVNDITTE
ncbi:MAG: bacillithiol system redox-active protein YtxJ [Sphingobacteriales bacterium]|nr:MAG: bacillithiol system redox-active protein YtxJ [Sphingobacteriales bacterium]